MAYRDRQVDLLNIVKEMQQAELPVISLKDQDASGTEIELTEIDPFTFFTNFNRGTTESSRLEMIRMIKEKCDLICISSVGATTGDVVNSKRRFRPLETG